MNIADFPKPGSREWLEWRAAGQPPIEAWVAARPARQDAPETPYSPIAQREAKTLPIDLAPTSQPREAILQQDGIGPVFGEPPGAEDHWEAFHASEPGAPQPINPAAVEGEPGRSYPSGGPVAVDDTAIAELANGPAALGANHAQRKRNAKRTRRDTDADADNWNNFPGLS